MYTLPIRHPGLCYFFFLLLERFFVYLNIVEMFSVEQCFYGFIVVKLAYTIYFVYKAL